MELLAHAAVATGLGAAFLLIAGGLGHIRHRQALTSVMARHQVLPAVAQRPLSVLLGPAEVAVGATAVVAALVAPHLAPIALAAVAGAYAVFGLYTTMQLRRAPDAPCGCFSGGEQVNLPVVAIRAGFFLAATAVAAVLVPAVAGLPLPAKLWLMLPALLVALAGWLVPAVLSPPPVRFAGPGAGAPAPVGWQRGHQTSD